MSVLLPFPVSTVWFLILTVPFRNGSIIACSTAFCSEAEMNEMSEYGIVP